MTVEMRVDFSTWPSKAGSPFICPRTPKATRSGPPSVRMKVNSPAFQRWAGRMQTESKAGDQGGAERGPVRSTTPSAYARRRAFSGLRGKQSRFTGSARSSHAAPGGFARAGMDH